MGRRFLPGFAAHVTDVEAAFPMLPFAPWVWPFMFHRLLDNTKAPISTWFSGSGLIMLILGFALTRLLV